MDGSKKTSSGGAFLVIRVTGDEGLLTHTPGSAWGTEDVQLVLKEGHKQALHHSGQTSPPPAEGGRK